MSTVVRVGGRLHSRGEVDGIAEDFRVAAATFADHDRAAINANADRDSRTAALAVAPIEGDGCINNRESGARGAFGVVVVRLGPAE